MPQYGRSLWYVFGMCSVCKTFGFIEILAARYRINPKLAASG